MPAVPVYMGYRRDGAQGWWDEITGTRNGTLKMRKYGEFIGKRYRQIPDIMWIAGGDNENCQWIKKKVYDGLLSGCTGTSFSAGEINNQCAFIQ